MAVPSRSVGSTFVGSCACSLASAARKCESRPGRTLLTARSLPRQLVTVAQSTLYPRHVRCSVTSSSAGAGLH